MTSTINIRRNTATRITEVGHLHVGDEVLIPGTDIFYTVSGFTFPHDTGHAYGFITVVHYGDMGSTTFRSTDAVRVAC